MNEKELTIILELIKNLSSEGKEAFIWWSVTNYGSELLTTLIVMGAFVLAVYTVARTVLAIKALSFPELGLKKAAYEAVRRYWLHTETGSVEGKKAYALYSEAKRILGETE